MKATMRRRLIWLAAAATTVAAMILTLTVSNRGQLGALAPPVVYPGQRILVFAPHCDDEVLGAGGLIQRALKVGALVRVVLVTNGDGFTQAARDEARSPIVPPGRYLELAYTRQGETLAALELLGLSSEHVTFLGFPDRGTSTEWEWNWTRDNPFTSPFTRTNRSPYGNSYVPHASYCGSAIVDELTSIIHEFKPDVIVVPHPNDTHPDHWGTHNFVMYALADLNLLDPQPAFSIAGPARPAVLTYLVHRANWPTAGSQSPQTKLGPPSSLTNIGTEWWSFDLTPEEARIKHNAIVTYQSQIAVTGRALLSFATSNDLFGEIPAAPVIAASEVPVVLDPVKDTLGRKNAPDADFRSIALKADAFHLYVRLTLEGAPSSSVRYNVHLHALPRDPQNAPICSDVSLTYSGGRLSVSKVISPEHVTADPSFAVHEEGNSIVLECPRSVIGPHQRLFIAAESHKGRAKLDRTAWRYVVVK